MIGNCIKKLLKFCPLSSHKGETIVKAVEACLQFWEIEEKFSLSMLVPMTLLVFTSEN